MKNRRTRLQLVADLIKNNSIGSQEEFLRLLRDKGCVVTQATLSRDLKTLKVSKVPTDLGGYMYLIPDNNAVKDKMLSVGGTHLSNASQTGFVSIQFSGHMAVIKTRNGYASGLAYDLDMSKSPEILGTIPGADTVFAVLREDVTHEKAMEIFSKFLPITIEPI